MHGKGGGDARQRQCLRRAALLALEDILHVAVRPDHGDIYTPAAPARVAQCAAVGVSHSTRAGGSALRIGDADFV